MLAEPALRADLRGRSLEQARRFSWRETAERTAEVYRRVGHPRGGGSQGRPMTVVYVINIVAALVLPLWPIWFARREVGLTWLNPISISTAIGIPVQLMIIVGGPMALLDGGLFHGGYQYGLLMANLLSSCSWPSAIVFFRLSDTLAMERFLPFQRVPLTPADLRRGAIFFLLVFAAAMYLLASAEFGVVNWILNPREGYQLYRVGHGHWYALATSALAASIALAFLGGGTVATVLAATGFYVVMGYFLGSKGVLLSIFATATIFLWFLRWRPLIWVMAGWARRSSSGSWS